MKDMFYQPYEPSGAKNRGDILAPATLAAFEILQRKKVYSEGSVFFARGQSPTGIYVLHAGRVELSIDCGDKKLILGFALPGDILGLSAVVSGAAHEMTAEATSPCRAGFIKGEDFRHFVSQHPEAAYWIVKLLSERLTVVSERLSFLRALVHPFPANRAEEDPLS